MIAGVTHLHVVKTAESDDWALQAGSLQQAAQQDLDQGLIPFYLCATVGTTSTATVDDLRGLGTVAKEHNIWCVWRICNLMCECLRCSLAAAVHAVLTATCITTPVWRSCTPYVLGCIGDPEREESACFQVYCPVGLCIGSQCLTAECLKHGITWQWCAGAC